MGWLCHCPGIVWEPIRKQELTCNSSGNSHSQSQSSQLAEPPWPHLGLKSGINVHKLITTLKKKVQVGNELSSVLPKSSHTRKRPPLRWGHAGIVDPSVSFIRYQLLGEFMERNTIEGAIKAEQDAKIRIKRSVQEQKFWQVKCVTEAFW